MAGGAHRVSDLLDVARSFLTVQEEPHGSNRSPEIDEWLTALKSPLGSPWCAAFIWACLRAAKDARQFVRSARVQTMVDGGVLHPASEARAGDVVVFYFANLKRYAHIGLVESVEGKVLVTLEGNTIPDGATGDTREGWGVQRKRRKVSDRIKVLRNGT